MGIESIQTAYENSEYTQPTTVTPVVIFVDHITADNYYNYINIIIFSNLI